MNFKKEFKENVMDYFLSEYLAGRTPNPCIACNRYVKWESLLQRAMEIGADYIATGHYARIERLLNGRYTLKTSVTQAKDQTYALYNLNQYQLSHTLMPVGAYTKEEIRSIAKKINLRVANKPDSQEICFIPDNDYGRFIRENSEEEIKPGNFVDEAGKVLGTHKGIPYYTVGQRKGLNLALGKPVFVKEIWPKTNEIVISDNESLFTTRIVADRVNFMSIEALEGEMDVIAKIRYNHRGAKAVVRRLSEDKIECIFEESQRAATPGQALVLYQEDGSVVGVGTITI
jgi:tRNA-specific 2-thiouridylase